jgi:mono/diheme cytochrome c family protein
LSNSPAGVVTPPPLSGAGHENNLDYTPRLTGDLAVRPDRALLAAPALWVDNTSPPRRSPEEQVEVDPAAGYDRIGLGLSPMNPGLVLVVVDPADGVPTGEVRLRYATSESGPVDPADTRVLRGFISAASWSPDGSIVTAALENSRVVLALDVDRSSPDDALSAMETGPIAAFIAGDGPRGIAWANERAWFLNAYSLQLSSVGLDTVRAALDAQEPPWLEGTPTLVADDEGASSPPVLDDALMFGRLLFSSSTNDHLSTTASGVSCSTCHFDGREDGLSWPDFDTVDRQTLSLVGGLSRTAPFTWTEEVPTVAEEARITSQVRLGGRGATQDELDAVAGWIEYLPAADHRMRGAASDAIERGRAIFESSNVNCVACHRAPLYTDLAPHDMFGLEGVDTPSLVGVAATAPYLHDGSAATLRDVLERGRDGSMGYTGDLSDAELDDLEAFLRSL